MGVSQKADLYTLSNGIRVVHLPRPKSSICYCGLMIDAGSRDELPEELGLAHFIEHSLFKGTGKRKTFHILNRLDSVGGEINAYTSKEDTVVHCSFLIEHSERAIELIADICFNSSFPEKEIIKEKEVIIDEIHSYLESPSEVIFDEFDELIFADHALGLNILGTEESVRNLKRQDIFQYQSRRYHPENMVFAFYGDITPKKLARLCEKYLSDFTSTGKMTSRIALPAYTPSTIHKKTDTQQAHAIIGSRAYGVEDDRKLPFLVLNNLLGGPAMNTLLNLNIREKFGIAYNLESHFQAYSDTGIFEIYIGTDKGQLDRGLRLIHKELRSCRDKKLGTRQLHSAKEQIKGHIALSNDGGSNVMLSLAKSVLLYGQIEDIEVVLKEIDAITAEDILEVANEIWSEDRLSTLTFT